MATVRKNRGRWVADYRDQHGKRRIEKPAGSFDNLPQERIAAQELLTKRMAEVARGDCVAARARLTFGDVCDRYLESKVNIRASTMRSYSGLIACYLRPYFVTWKIHTITASDIERYRSELARGLPPAIATALVERCREAKPKWSEARVKQSSARRKPGTRTINKSLTLLTMIFNYAARHRWVDHNPAEYVEKLKDEAYLHHRPVDENILTPDEVRRLVAATDEHHRLLVQTAVFTGMRQGELLGLQWGTSIGTVARFMSGAHGRMAPSRSRKQGTRNAASMYRTSCFTHSRSGDCDARRVSWTWSSLTEPAILKRTPTYYNDASIPPCAAQGCERFDSTI